MLGKLIKYDFLANYKLLFSLYGLTLILSIINRLLSESDITFVNIFASLTMFLLVILLIATLMVTFFVIVARYFKNLYGDEGYLMNTLPVKSSFLILSKLITGIIFTTISLMIVATSVYILLIGTPIQDSIAPMFSDILKVFSNISGVDANVISVAFISYLILGIFSYVAFFFAAISIGHLLPMNKILGSFIGVIILNVINQTISFALLAVGSVAFKIDVFTPTDANVPANLKEYLPYIYFAYFALLIVLSICYFYFSNYVLKKKLNLE